MCVEFRHLNKVGLNDGTTFPHIDLLVDNTKSPQLLYFIDGCVTLR